MDLFLSILIVVIFGFALSLKFLLGKDEEVCKPGCSNISLFTKLEECPVCGGTSESDLTKCAK